MKKAKKILASLSSMKCGITLLVLVLAACIAGSLIPQGETAATYTSDYPGFLSTVILKLGLDDVFHVWWFAGLTTLLVLNLFGCNLIHFPQILRQMKNFTADNAASWSCEAELAVQEKPDALFDVLGFHAVQDGRSSEGKHTLYAVRNRCGTWGAWLTHLGILIIITGFTLSQMYTVKYTVYGVPGQTKHVEGTDYDLTIDDFQIPLREDETVVQYVSQLTLTDTRTGEVFSGAASVNHPLTLDGLKIYQNSTGWAADVQVWRDGEMIQNEIVCAGEYTTIEAKNELYVVFRAFYPDYVTDASGKPATASSNLSNPAYLYMLYYGSDLLGMNVLMANEEITVDDIEIRFVNPRSYTLLQLKEDPFTMVPLAGGIVLMIALLLAFYLRTEELYAVEQEGVWNVYARSRKGGLLYEEKLRDRAQTLEKEKKLTVLTWRTDNESAAAD